MDLNKALGVFYRPYVNTIGSRLTTQQLEVLSKELDKTVINIVVKKDGALVKQTSIKDVIPAKRLPIVYIRKWIDAIEHYFEDGIAQDEEVYINLVSPNKAILLDTQSVFDHLKGHHRFYPDQVKRIESTNAVYRFLGLNDKVPPLRIMPFNIGDEAMEYVFSERIPCDYTELTKGLVFVVESRTYLSYSGELLDTNTKTCDVSYARELNSYIRRIDRLSSPTLKALKHSAATLWLNVMEYLLRRDVHGHLCYKSIHRIQLGNKVLGRWEVKWLNGTVSDVKPLPLD